MYNIIIMAKDKHSLSYKFSNEELINEKFTKKSILDGDKGLSFFYSEKSDKEFFKLMGRENVGTGKVEVVTQKNDNKKTEDLAYDDFVKFVKKEPKLTFVSEYLASRKKPSKKMSRPKRSSKKPSKKSSTKKSSTKKSSKKKSSKKKTTKW